MTSQPKTMAEFAAIENARRIERDGRSNWRLTGFMSEAKAEELKARRQKVKELWLAGAGKVEIAKICRCSHVTVNNDLGALGL